MPESLQKMSFASCIFCYSILSKLGARTRFTRNISTIDRVTTTETSLLKRRMRATKGKHKLDPLRQQFSTIQNIILLFLPGIMDYFAGHCFRRPLEEVPTAAETTA